MVPRFVGSRRNALAPCEGHGTVRAMGRPFITLWSQPQLEIERRAGHLETELTHLGDAQVRARGVERGDRVYVLATERARLLLLARLTVERVVRGCRRTALRS